MADPNDLFYEEVASVAKEQVQSMVKDLRGTPPAHRIETLLVFAVNYILEHDLIIRAILNKLDEDEPRLDRFPEEMARVQPLMGTAISLLKETDLALRKAWDEGRPVANIIPQSLAMRTSDFLADIEGDWPPGEEGMRGPVSQ
jgi:hypothetical protein